MKGLVAGIIRSWLKKSLKMGFVAVDLTEVLSSTKQVKIYFILFEML